MLLLSILNFLHAWSTTATECPIQGLIYKKYRWKGKGFESAVSLYLCVHVGNGNKKNPYCLLFRFQRIRRRLKVNISTGAPVLENTKLIHNRQRALCISVSGKKVHISIVLQIFPKVAHMDVSYKMLPLLSSVF